MTELSLKLTTNHTTEELSPNDESPELFTKSVLLQLLVAETSLLSPNHPPFSYLHHNNIPHHIVTSFTPFLLKGETVTSFGFLASHLPCFQHTPAQCCELLSVGQAASFSMLVARPGPYVPPLDRPSSSQIHLRRLHWPRNDDS